MNKEITNNHDGQEQSSLTIGKSSQFIKENLKEFQKGSEIKREDHSFEYRYMDGVLGYVEP